jgi:hypothetical protein
MYIQKSTAFNAAVVCCIFLFRGTNGTLASTVSRKNRYQYEMLKTVADDEPETANAPAQFLATEEVTVFVFRSFLRCGNFFQVA